MNAEFCDTNVLVYGYETTGGRKNELAVALVTRLWESGCGVVSVQVLQELFVVLTRKVALPRTLAESRAIVADVATWRVIEPNRLDVLTAIDRAERFGISFWDAMLLTTAIRAEAHTVWSEDLADGQNYDGVVVRNPFSAPASP